MSSTDEFIRSAVSDRHADVESLLDAHPPESSFSISNATVRAVANLARAGACRNILEIGAGRSSIIVAEALSRAGGGRLTSVESSPRFSARAWSLVRDTPNVDSLLLVARPKLRASAAGVHFWFDVAAEKLRQRGPFDLILIDAPHQSFGRDASLHVAHRHLALPAIVVLDDAGRPGEMKTIEGWLARYPGLRVVETSLVEKHGFAVLAFEGAVTRPVGMVPWLRSVQQRVRSRRKVKLQRQLEADK